jgi:lactoylglutathione lyase
MGKQEAQPQAYSETAAAAMETSRKMRMQDVGGRSSMPERAVPVRGLFESHLTVTDLSRSIAFYRDVVGLSVALEVPERGAAFFWCGTQGTAMLGLWSLGSAPMGLNLHIAFDVELENVLDSPGRLKALGVSPLSFFGEETDEPTVIGWMPAAAVSFVIPTVTCSSTSPCSTRSPARIWESFPGPSGPRSDSASALAGASIGQCHADDRKPRRRPYAGELAFSPA